MSQRTVSISALIRAPADDISDKALEKKMRVRTRLTISFVVMLASVLLIFWALTALFLFQQMRSQLEHFAVQDIETVEGLLYFNNAGGVGVREDYHNHPESKQVLERLLQVMSTDGTVLFRNERLGTQTLGGGLLPNEGQGGYSVRSARM